jgi:hypothetical protein
VANFVTSGKKVQTESDSDDKTENGELFFLFTNLSDFPLRLEAYGYV